MKGKKEKEVKDKKEFNIAEHLGNREKVKLDSDKIRRRDLKIKILKLGLMISSLFLIIIYFLLRALYTNGTFTISIDQQSSPAAALSATPSWQLLKLPKPARLSALTLTSPSNPKPSSSPR